MDTSHTLALDSFLPYMRDVIRCEQSLRELSLTWRMIEASAKMNCPIEARTIIPTMTATRDGFDRLEEELVTSMVREKVANVLAEIGTKAHNVIDIVVRNLYERTADVGFLATDNELCTFVAGLHSDPQAIYERLIAYRNKYTVYDEIMLLDVNGNVLMQIDDYMEIEGSQDSLIKETLASDDYVETFRATDLRPNKRQALIYSRKMHHPETNEVVGLLCLCFNFEEEMAGIFHTHRDPAERSNMLLLDGENRVIASADPLWMPPGSIVPVNRDASAELQIYGGRQYLIRTFFTDGYQAYKGPPGWQGQVMVPVDVAFSASNSNALDRVDSSVSDGLLAHAQTFCPPLYEIMNAAETIRRVVWNGQVMTAGQNGDVLKLKTVLDQISETGNRSNELFSKSIRDLYETVLTSSLRDGEFASQLLVDLLDRNLYERANDCRWWALTPELRATLATGEFDQQAVAKMTEILAYINSLYTVYTRLFIYDRNGTIVASTELHGLNGAPSVVGMAVGEAVLANTLGLPTEQHYHVTAFERDALYDGRPTYVYHAAIRDPENAEIVVGGIGIVFDSALEFESMLRGGLGERTEMTAFYINRSGRIISSTDPLRPVGSQLEIEPEFLQLNNGCSASRIVLHDGNYAIIGCSVSSGYREFKVSDGYEEDVIAVVYKAFGAVAKRMGVGYSQRQKVMLEDAPSVSGGQEFATFFIDDKLYALPAISVLEAYPGLEITPNRIGNSRACVGMLALPREVIWVFDLGYLVRGESSVVDSSSQVLIAQHDGHSFGLLVSELHGVPEFNVSQIVPTPLARLSEGMLIPQVIKANAGRLLIQAIDIACLFKLLNVGAVLEKSDNLLDAA